MVSKIDLNMYINEVMYHQTFFVMKHTHIRGALTGRGQGSIKFTPQTLLLSKIGSPAIEIPLLKMATWPNYIAQIFAIEDQVENKLRISKSIKSMTSAVVRVILPHKSTPYSANISVEQT